VISSVAPYAACHINIEFHASVVDLIVDLSEPNDGDASARSSDQAMASANGRA